MYINFLSDLLVYFSKARDSSNRLQNTTVCGEVVERTELAVNDNDSV